MGGDHRTSVPPINRTRTTPGAAAATGRRACRTRVMLPAVPMSKEKRPATKDMKNADKGEGGERNQDRLEPVEGRERLCLEDAMQKRRVDHGDLKGHRSEHSDDQFRVREQADLPNRLARRSHSEHKEE